MNETNAPLNEISTNVNIFAAHSGVVSISRECRHIACLHHVYGQQMCACHLCELEDQTGCTKDGRTFAQGGQCG
jgi:hypothetical protein